MARKRFGVWISVLAVLGTAGCGGTSDRPQVAPVSGTVTYNGAAVDGATVVFGAEGASTFSQGTTDSGGKFRLTTYEPNDGAIVGVNVVRILKNEQSADGSAGEVNLDDPGDAYSQQMGGETSAPESKSELPERYADATTTPLKETVTAEGPNEFTFNLTDE